MPADDESSSGGGGGGGGGGGNLRMVGIAKPPAPPGVMILLKVLPPDDPARFAPSDISFASVFHSTDGEWVLPPGTYFSTAGRGGKVIEDKIKKITIVEVVPRAAASWF